MLLRNNVQLHHFVLRLLVGLLGYRLGDVVGRIELHFRVGIDGLVELVVQVEVMGDVRVLRRFLECSIISTGYLGLLHDWLVFDLCCRAGVVGGTLVLFV